MATEQAKAAAAGRQCRGNRSEWDAMKANMKRGMKPDMKPDRKQRGLKPGLKLRRVNYWGLKPV